MINHDWFGSSLATRNPRLKCTFPSPRYSTDIGHALEWMVPQCIVWDLVLAPLLLCSLFRVHVLYIFRFGPMEIPGFLLFMNGSRVKRKLFA